MNQRVAVVACTEADMWLHYCAGCHVQFPYLELRDHHEATCHAMRDRHVLEALRAQALDDGRFEDAREIEEEQLW